MDRGDEKGGSSVSYSPRPIDSRPNVFDQEELHYESSDESLLREAEIFLKGKYGPRDKNVAP